MSRVTSKYQVTLPRKIADAYCIRPGDDIDWVPAGEAIRVVPANKLPAPETPESRLRLFDQATERLRHRKLKPEGKRSLDRRWSRRGWTREDLYVRGRAH